MNTEILDDMGFKDKTDIAAILRKYAVLLCLVLLVKAVFALCQYFIYDYFSVRDITWLRSAVMFSAYLINIIVVVVLYGDMKRYDNMTVPILILTLFHCEAGAILYLVLLVYNSLKNKDSHAGG